jgi:hypothetical protein
MTSLRGVDSCCRFDYSAAILNFAWLAYVLGSIVRRAAFALAAQNQARGGDAGIDSVPGRVAIVISDRFVTPPFSCVLACALV